MQPISQPPGSLRSGALRRLEAGDLLDAAGVAALLELRLQPDAHQVDFSKMTAAQQVAYHKARWDRILG